MKPRRETALLRATFEEFTRATRSLQSAYDELAERSRAIDRALADTNARLTSVLDSMPSGVVSVGSDGRIATVNRAARRILRPALDDAAGREPGAFRDDRGRAVLALSARALPKTERTLELGGREVTIVSRVVPLRGGSRRALFGALEIFDDVTEIRALADRVRSLDRLASLGEATAAIAHQIRNPLSGVVGFGGLLRRSLAARLAPGDEALRFLEKIREGISRADGVVTSTLALARRGPLALAPVRAGALLAEAAAEAAQEFAEGAPRPAIRIEAPAPGSGPEVIADRAQLKQAVLNLVRNALESLAGSGGGTLRLEAARARGAVRLRVADTGPGVAREIRDKLFQPFATTRANGTGLGLAFARKVAEVHGGTIVLERTSRGASFRIDLPAGASRSTPRARTGRRPEALRK